MRVLGFAIVATSLAGCSLERGDICTPLATPEARSNAETQAAAAGTDPSVRVFAAMAVKSSCLQITARRFALAPDAADVVADAVVAHCSVAISREALAQQQADRHNNNTSPVFSFRTGGETTLEARAFAEAKADALAATVEARAGNCRAPA